jgi:radical SAM protein (TIGR01212 family)
MAFFPQSSNMRQRYHDFNTYLKNIYGCRVQKISIDAGLSCPNRDGTLSTGGCIYCNVRGSGTGAHAKGLSVVDQILAAKSALFRRYKAKKFIAYFQSFTNTYGSLNTLGHLYEQALGVEDVVGISIGTRPDCVEEPILDLIQGYADHYLVWIEYGLQSANDFTLSLINRGHDFNCFKAAVDATKDRGIHICAHVILGLPRETKADMLKTAQAIADMDIDGIKLHLLYVVKGTKLETLYRANQYKCLEQNEYVDIVCGFLERIPKHVVIQRLTGDPHPNELVAPAWSLRKMETIALIRKTLETRDTWQGKYVEGSPKVFNT